MYIVRTARKRQFHDFYWQLKSLQSAEWKENLHLYISGETEVAIFWKEKTLMQGMNALEKKIVWYKLVTKTSETEIEQ